MEDEVKKLFLCVFLVIILSCTVHAAKPIESGMFVSYCIPQGDMGEAFDWDIKGGFLFDYSFTEKILLSAETSYMELYTPSMEELHFLQAALLFGGKYMIISEDVMKYYAKAGCGYYNQWVEFYDQGQEQADMFGIYLGGGMEYMLNDKIAMLGELHYDLVKDTNILNLNLGTKYRF